MLADKITDRLDGAIPELSGRVQGASQLAMLMGRNELPQATPAAFVIPLGLDAGQQMDATSVHQQMVTEQMGVVLVIDHASDANQALAPLDQLVQDVITAIAGWQPEGEIDAFALRRGRLLDAQNGTLIYQLDFSMISILRI